MYLYLYYYYIYIIKKEKLTKKKEDMMKLRQKDLRDMVRTGRAIDVSNALSTNGCGGMLLRISR